MSREAIDAHNAKIEQTAIAKLKELIREGVHRGAEVRSISIRIPKHGAKYGAPIRVLEYE